MRIGVKVFAMFQIYTARNTVVQAALNFIHIDCIARSLKHEIHPFHKEAKGTGFIIAMIVGQIVADANGDAGSTGRHLRVLESGVVFGHAAGLITDDQLPRLRGNAQVPRDQRLRLDHGTPRQPVKQHCSGGLRPSLAKASRIVRYTHGS